MSQRESGYERKDRDLYETPAWVTAALRPHIEVPRLIWEPAAGTSKMAAVLATWGGGVVASDITPHPLCYTADFLTAPIHGSARAIITNPPYALAQEFAERAIEMMRPVDGLVALLLRTDFDHAKTRQHLFSGCKAFAKKVVLTKRIVWFDRPGAAPSFNHAWYIWDHLHVGAPTIAYGPEKEAA